MCKVFLLFVPTQTPFSPSLITPPWLADSFQHGAVSQSGWLEWAGWKKRPSDLGSHLQLEAFLPLNPCLCSCTPDSLLLCSVLHEQPCGRGTLVTLCQLSSSQCSGNFAPLSVSGRSWLGAAHPHSTSTACHVHCWS